MTTQSLFLNLSYLALIASISCAGTVDDSAADGHGSGTGAATPYASTANGSVSGSGYPESNSHSGSDSGSTSKSGAGGAAKGCQSDAGCAGSPYGEICDTQTSTCVQCFPSNDTCPIQQYCNSGFRCVPGCKGSGHCGSTGCSSCDLNTHQCVGCCTDTDCGEGTICDSNSLCVPRLR